MSQSNVIVNPDEMLLLQVAGAAERRKKRGASPELCSASQAPGKNYSPRRSAGLGGGGAQTTSAMAMEKLQHARETPRALLGWRIAVTGENHTLVGSSGGAGEPVSKGELERRINQSGGTVLHREEQLSDTGRQLPAAMRKTSVLVGNAPRRTEKYLLALALGVACVRASWVVASLAGNGPAPLQEHLLPAGTSHVSPMASGRAPRPRYHASTKHEIEQRLGSEWQPVFDGLSVALTESRAGRGAEAEMWKRVLPAGGAHLVEASVVRRGPELEDSFECECLLATHGSATTPAWVRKTVRELVSGMKGGEVGGRRWERHRGVKVRAVLGGCGSLCLFPSP